MQLYKKPSFDLSNNDKLKALPEYLKIVSVIEGLIPAGTLQKLQGNCVVAAEMICGLLDGVGIKSRIVECQLTITKETDPIELYFIGFDNIGFKGELDTHLIVVTETEIPLLIDVSIGHYLPETRPVIIEEFLSPKDDSIIGQISFDICKLQYTLKKNIKLPTLHQKNIFDRINFEKNIEGTLKFLRMGVICAISLSFINFVLNWILIVLKMIYL